MISGLIQRVIGTVKAVRVQPWTGREGSRRLRLPDFMTVGALKW